MKPMDKKRRKSKIQIRRIKLSLLRMEVEGWQMIDLKRILATSISKQYFKTIPTPTTAIISKTYQ